MKITIKTQGTAAIRQALLKVAHESEQHLMRLITDMGNDISERAADTVLAQRQAPLFVPSALADSLTVKPRSGGVVVSADMSYAPFVELGTSRTRPAPFLGPAFDEVIREYAHRLRTEGRR